jgi:hypothetical protein
MQTAGKGIGRVAGALVELAAGVEPGECQHDHRYFFIRVQTDRDAAAVVGDGDRAVEVQLDMQILGMTAECFVGGVVDDFLNDVGW